MNIAYYIKCDVCGCVTKVKVQAGWLEEHPIAIYCGKCNILIEGKVIQNPIEGTIKINFKNASQTLNNGVEDFFLESSGEFVTLKMVPGDSKEAMISTIAPPFIRNVWGKSRDLYYKNFKTLLELKNKKWSMIRRVFELWNSHSSEIFLKQELRRQLIKIQDQDTYWIEKGLHILFREVGKYMKSEEDNKNVVQLCKWIKEIPNYKLNQLYDLLKNRDYLNNCKRRIYEITDQYIDKFQYMMPAYQVLLERKRIDFEKLGITTTSFEILKDFYISCYELLGDMVPILNGLNNISLRGKYDNTRGTKIKYEDLFYKPNSLKIKNYVSEEKFSKLVDIHFNEKLRNAIGHYDYRIEGKSQKIFYTRNTNHGGISLDYQNEIYLLEFTIECLELFRSIIYIEEIIYLLETKDYSSNIVNQRKNLRKLYPNDLCLCGSGKKFKHCCKR